MVRSGCAAATARSRVGRNSSVTCAPGVTKRARALDERRRGRGERGLEGLLEERVEDLLAEAQEAALGERAERQAARPGVAVLHHEGGELALERQAVLLEIAEHHGEGLLQEGLERGRDRPALALALRALHPPPREVEDDGIRSAQAQDGREPVRGAQRPARRRDAGADVAPGAIGAGERAVDLDRAGARRVRLHGPEVRHHGVRAGPAEDLRRAAQRPGPPALAGLEDHQPELLDEARAHLPRDGLGGDPDLFPVLVVGEAQDGLARLVDAAVPEPVHDVRYLAAPEPLVEDLHVHVGARDRVQPLHLARLDRGRERLLEHEQGALVAAGGDRQHAHGAADLARLPGLGRGHAAGDEHPGVGAEEALGGPRLAKGLPRDGGERAVAEEEPDQDGLVPRRLELPREHVAQLALEELAVQRVRLGHQRVVDRLAAAHGPAHAGGELEQGKGSRRDDVRLRPLAPAPPRAHAHVVAAPVHLDLQPQRAPSVERRRRWCQASEGSRVPGPLAAPSLRGPKPRAGDPGARWSQLSAGYAAVPSTRWTA